MFESLVNSSSGKTYFFGTIITVGFESLVNSSSGKTAASAAGAYAVFESLVNSSSGKTLVLHFSLVLRLRALLIQVVVKQRERSSF